MKKKTNKILICEYRVKSFEIKGKLSLTEQRASVHPAGDFQKFANYVNDFASDPGNLDTSSQKPPSAKELHK